MTTLSLAYLACAVEVVVVVIDDEDTTTTDAIAASTAVTDAVNEEGVKDIEATVGKVYEAPDVAIPDALLPPPPLSPPTSNLNKLMLMAPARAVLRHSIFALL